MSNNKYIILNCPATYKNFRMNENGEIYINEYRCKHNLLGSCQDCTDCLLKQIIELCKETCRKRCTNDCLGTKRHCGYGQILKLLDIQEVE